MRYLIFLSLLTSCNQSTYFTRKVPPPQTPAGTPKACAMIINQPGTYVLDHNIDADYCGIQINSSDVRLDLNGYTIKGPNDLHKLSYGIKSLENSKIEVFNGKITGFMYGVLIASKYGRGDDIHDNAAHHLTVSNSSFRGIQAEGYNVAVYNNEVTESGRTEVYPDAYGFGIEVKGPNCLVKGNRVTETYGTTNPGKVIGEGVAISFSHFNTYCVAEDNHIQNSITVTNKSTFGFWVDVYSQITLRNNYVRNMHYSGIIPPFSILDNNDLDIPFANVITDRP